MYVQFVIAMFFLITYLQCKVLEAETRNEQIAEEKNKYAKLLEGERASSLQNGTRVILYFFFLAMSLAVVSDS